MFTNLKFFAKEDDDSEELVFRKLLILIIASSCSVCGIIWAALYYFIFGFGIIAFLPFLFTIIVGSTIVVSHYLRNHVILIYAQLICITWISAFLQWCIGGMDESGLVIAWSFLGPLGALIFLSLRQSIVWMLMFLFIVVVSAVFEPGLLGYKPAVSDSVKTLFYIMNVGTASTIVFAASTWFVKSIQHEKSRSENLLLNILPEEVARELKAKGSADAKLINEVTVLFTDFKGFTSISEQLTPKELVNDIHECFSAFDNITGKYGLEKIKTIGDSYMAAGGLPTPNKTNASDAVKAALEIRQFIAEGKARKIAAGKPYFEIRIGIHTGPVVAGIVGVKKFAYDIWGDTVNTASRI
jgi:class 3 adenylate cyclase